MNVTLSKSYSTFRSTFPPSLPPRESSATSSVLISKKQLITAYCACLGKREPVLNREAVEPLELATYIADFYSIPQRERANIQRKIIEIASCILSLIDSKKELALNRQSNFHSFSKNRLLFEDAFINGDYVKTDFYFDSIHNEFYAKVKPIKILDALHESYTGRKHLPPILLKALDALKEAGLTLETAIKTYYALEARGELDGIEIIETLGQTKQRGRKVDEERIKHTKDACKRVLVKYGEDDKIKQTDFRREVTAAMGKVNAHQNTVSQEWANIPSSRKYQNCPPKVGQRKTSS